MPEVIRAHVKAVVECNVLLQLNEEEARALDAMFGYGADAFLKGFYKQCGKSYVQPHEAGVRSLHDKIRGLMAGPLEEVNRVRQTINAALSKQHE